ncbi:MAG: DNA repair protein RadC [Flavobacteriales bacterium]|nr:DNA repair protein RadC [Flavobacteriales bacterium]
MKIVKLPQTRSIKNWSIEDRPREKLLNKGRSVVTEAELIAILLGSGNRNESAVGLSRRMLQDNNNDLNRLSKLGVVGLMKYNGIGEAKAVSVIAALELGRRRKKYRSDPNNKIQSSSGVFELVKPSFLDLPHEEFWIVCLNRANKVISKLMISRGGVSGTVADLKLIFKIALEQLASSIIVCHNHPSGNLEPSAQDIRLTAKIKEAGKIMDIPLLDHLVVSDYNYFSFADNGMI